jgi:hypothetical protein
MDLVAEAPSPAAQAAPEPSGEGSKDSGPGIHWPGAPEGSKDELIKALRDMLELVDVLATHCSDRVVIAADPRPAAARAALSRVEGR